MKLAFEHLNLRFNPFGELDALTRSQVAVLPPFALRPGQVLQVMGEAGRGKTTHLLAWHHASPGSLYEYIPEGRDRIASGALPPACFIDEAQRLRPRDRTLLFDHVQTLVIATHQDLSRHTHRVVDTVLLSGLDIDKLEQIVTRRIEAARRGPGRVPTLRRSTLIRLVDRFGDDLRSMERFLYEIFQSLEGPCDVEV